jgi:hypothetical protein
MSAITLDRLRKLALTTPLRLAIAYPQLAVSYFYSGWFEYAVNHPTEGIAAVLKPHAKLGPELKFRIKRK